MSLWLSVYDLLQADYNARLIGWVRTLELMYDYTHTLGWMLCLFQISNSTPDFLTFKLLCLCKHMVSLCSLSLFPQNNLLLQCPLVLSLVSNAAASSLYSYGREIKFFPNLCSEVHVENSIARVCVCVCELERHLRNSQTITSKSIPNFQTSKLWNSKMAFKKRHWRGLAEVASGPYM